MPRVRISASIWKSKDGTIYRADEDGYIECTDKHAREYKGKPEPVIERPDYGSKLKKDLVSICKKRGIESGGTKAEIVKRLEKDDG